MSTCGVATGPVNVGQSAGLKESNSQRVLCCVTFIDCS